MHIFIDRIEGDIAVVEWKSGRFELPKGLLPKDVKEGDFVRVILEVDRDYTKSKREAMQRMIDRLRSTND